MVRINVGCFTLNKFIPEWLLSFKKKCHCHCVVWSILKAHCVVCIHIQCWEIVPFSSAVKLFFSSLSAAWWRTVHTTSPVGRLLIIKRKTPKHLFVSTLSNLQRSLCLSLVWLMPFRNNIPHWVLYFFSFLTWQNQQSGSLQITSDKYAWRHSIEMMRFSRDQRVRSNDC